MNALYLVLRLEAALCALFGLWSHDWRLIVASLVCWLIVPLVGHELKADAQR